MNKTFPILYGTSTIGKVKSWQILVHNGSGNPQIVIIHGYLDGKKQENARVVKGGKNIGRSNETSVYEQAVSEAASEWNKKKDKNYSESIPTKETKKENILPMLAQKFINRKHDIDYPCYVQPKLDGVRCLAMKTSKTEVKYLTRGGKSYTAVEHLTPYILKMIGVGDILDGELYVHGWTFQEIVRNVKKLRDTSKLVEYWVYDKADPKMTYQERYDWLNDANLDDDCPVKLLKTSIAHREADVYTYHNKFVAIGFEGIIIRNRSGKYVFDHRSKDLQKFKLFEDKEFPITGGHEGDGLEVGCVIFECMAENGKPFNVRPKGSRELRKEWLLDIKNIIGKELTVRYQNYSEEGIPIFPVGISVRDYE
jgi:DNA ligase-1